MIAASANFNISIGRSVGILLAVMSIAAQTSALAADTPARPAARAPEELRGIVTNQTLTPLGQEFYTRFNDFWRENADFEDYSFVVSERHSKRYGSQIFIIYRQRQVFAGNLPYRYGQIRAFSADAAEKAHTNIVGMSLRAATDRDPDLADDEL